MKAAKKEKEQAAAELRAETAATRLDVKSVGVKLDSARRRVELYRSSVLPQSEAALKVAAAGYEAGTAGFLDLLDSQRTWLQLQMEYYRALARYWSYLAAMERIVGRDLAPASGAQKEPAP